MLPDNRFLRQPKYFWANVRTISQQIGYATRRSKKNPVSTVKVPTIAQIRKSYESNGLTTDHIVGSGDLLTEFGRTLLGYFEYRAEVLNDYVEPRLMVADTARAKYEELKNQLSPTCPLPMNKQKGDMKAPAHFRR